MNSKNLVAALVASVVLGILPVSAQTLLWSDSFDNTAGWAKGLKGEMSASNQQFVIGGEFGPTPVNQQTETYAWAAHALPISGALREQQTLEARVDLVEVNQSNTWASLQFWWSQGLAYGLFKDEDEILLIKAWNTPSISVAFFFYEPRLVKNQNVTLVLSLTRLGQTVRIDTKILDKDNADAVLFERSVTDTPLSDPVATQAREFPGLPELQGTPWPIQNVPGNVELGTAWADSQSSSVGPAQVVFDNVEVRLYESPPLKIKQLSSSVMLSWPLTRGQFALESAPGVNGSYSEVADPSWKTNNGQNEITIQAPDLTRFFRLHQVR